MTKKVLFLTVDCADYYGLQAEGAEISCDFAGFYMIFLLFFPLRILGMRCNIR
jgi:hypothetical protein